MLDATIPTDLANEPLPVVRIIAPGKSVVVRWRGQDWVVDLVDGAWLALEPQPGDNGRSLTGPW